MRNHVYAAPTQELIWNVIYDHKQEKMEAKRTNWTAVCSERCSGKFQT